MNLPVPPHPDYRQILLADVGRTFIDEPLCRHNSWRVGGAADLLIEPESTEHVRRIIQLTAKGRIPLVVIGQGTNVLFDDAGVRGVVMKIGSRLAGMKVEGQQIRAQAGVWVPRLALTAMKSGLTGLEHCIGIPGTLGGLVIMNGGSHRHGIGEQIVAVTVVDRDGSICQITADECCFGYRYSALQARGAVVAEVELKCPRGDVREIRRAMLDDLRTRRRKFPLKQPNCGSVFLSSAEMHATVGPPGKIIEDAGLKGLRRGNAEVSSRHANFIVNLGDARSADILWLITKVRSVIRERIDFDLSCEVRYVSPQGQIVPAHLSSDHPTGL